MLHKEEKSRDDLAHLARIVERLLMSLAALLAIVVELNDFLHSPLRF